MKKFLAEFKEFAMKGNVVDLAVGVIIGGAFSKIVTALVNDILMPILAIPTGEVSFAALSFDINGTVIKYGSFIQATVDFVTIAFCIFLFVKLISKLHKKKEEAPAPAQPSEEVLLLREIRDSLKK